MKSAKFAKIVFVAGVAILMAGCDRPNPQTCEVSLNSPEAGQLNVITTDRTSKLPFHIPLQIEWLPLSEASRMTLAVMYQGSDLSQLKRPSGGHLKFKLPAGVHTDDMEIVVESQGQEIWRFGRNQIEVGQGSSAGYAFVSFSSGKQGGVQMIDAIAASKDVKIVVFETGKIVLADSFRLSATGERNLLLSEARTSLEQRDPRFCRPIL